MAQLQHALADAAQQAADARRLAALAEATAARHQWTLEISQLIAAYMRDERLLARVAQALVPRLGDWCTIDLVSEHGTFTRAAMAHHDPARVADLAQLQQLYDRHTAPPPWYAQLDGGHDLVYAPQRRTHHRETCRDGEHLAIVERIGAAAVIRMPLEVNGRRFGVLSVIHATDPLFYTPEHLATVRTIGRRLSFALEHRELYERALAADRAKSAFLSVMSHELRTPLTSILGYAELMEETTLAGPLTPMQQEFLRAMTTNGHRLLELMNHVLDAAAQPAVQPEHVPLRLAPVSLVALVAEVAEAMAPAAAQKGLTLVPHVDVVHAWVESDVALLRQVLTNLVQNAIKYTDAGRIRVTAFTAQDRYVLSVADTGVGIPSEALDHVFAPFFQVDQPLTRSAGGVGLGLHIVDRIVRRLGGTAHVESALGVGSRFTVRLPMLPPVADRPQAAGG